MHSISPRFSVDIHDFLKSLRAGLIVLFSTFIAGAMGNITPILQTGSLDIHMILNSCFIAGVTAVIDLIRRYVTDYSRNDVILQEAP